MNASNKKVIEFGLITRDQKIIDEVKDICKEFEYSLQIWEDTKAYHKDDTECRLLCYSDLDKEMKRFGAEVAEFTQVAQQVSQEAYIIGIVPKLLAKDQVDFLKKSGLNTIILASELAESSKLGFLSSQSIRSKYIPIKDSDLIAGAEVTFDLYHLMTLRNKFIKIVKKGDAITDDKIVRLKSVGEFYIPREQMKSFTEYTNDVSPGDPDYHFRRTRAYFLEFSVTFLDMVNILTDQSVTLSFEEGKELMDKCLLIAGELTQCLTMIEPEQIWNVVNNSVIGDFGSIERAPAIAAYVSYFGTMIGTENLDELIFAALVADLGLVNVPLNVTKKIRQGKMDQFNGEERRQYQQYLKRSLEAIASRRLPVEKNIKDIIATCRENADGFGFPSGRTGEFLTDESQLLHFAYIFDNISVLKMGKVRKNKFELLKELILKESKKTVHFTPDFLNRFLKGFPELFPEGMIA